MTAQPAWTAAHSAALTAAPVVGINFHHVPPDHRAQVAQQLRAAARLGPALDPDDLSTPAPGPRLFVAFYDGYRDTSLFGAALCAELGLRAYFFPVFSSPDPMRGQLSDADLADIATAHEVGFHTASHLRAADITPDNLAVEVLGPLDRIERATGRRPRIGAWRGGLRFDPTQLGDRTLQAEGVRALVSNWSIEELLTREPQISSATG